MKARDIQTGMMLVTKRGPEFVREVQHAPNFVGDSLRVLDASEVAVTLNDRTIVVQADRRVMAYRPKRRYQ